MRGRPSAMGCALRAALALATVWCAALPAAGFDVHRHLFMTRSALGELQGNALAGVLAGTVYPDISGCAVYGYCEGWKRQLVTTGCRGFAASIIMKLDADTMRDLGSDHFDANEIELSRVVATRRVERARAILTRVGRTIDSDEERALVNGALLLFGVALHGIQDFYAHSNYVECYFDDLEKGKWASIRPWDGRPDASCPRVFTDAAKRPLKGLVTGEWEAAPGVEVAPDDIIHKDLNKDNPEAEQGQHPIPGGTPENLYQAVSGQPPGHSSPSDPYESSGLAVRHTMQAYRALVYGEKLFEGSDREVVTDAPAQLVRMRGTESSPIEQLLAAAAQDEGLTTILASQLAESSFASCMLGGPAAEALLELLEQ